MYIVLSFTNSVKMLKSYDTSFNSLRASIQSIYQAWTTNPIPNDNSL